MGAITGFREDRHIASERTMSRGLIKIKLFGNFEAANETGAPLLVRGERSRAILAGLACEPPSYWTRDRLASILWEGRDLQQARSSLRQELVRLRADLGLNAAADWSSGPSITLPAQFSIDVIDFKKAVRADRALEATVLYSGDLLQDSRLTSSQVQQWLADKRNRLRSEAIACLV